MLRALVTPAIFLGMLLGFLLAVVVSYLAQAVAARLTTGRWSFGARPKDAIDPRRVLDPFGAVAAAVAGPGWGRSVEPARKTVAAIVVTSLIGPIAAIVVGLAVLALLPILGETDPTVLAFIGPADLLGGLDAPFVDGVVLAAGLELIAIGVLGFVPLPPLPMWTILDRLVPDSLGWQKAKFWLVERNIGVVVLLVLLLLPLGGGIPLLVLLVDAGSRLLTGLLW